MTHWRQPDEPDPIGGVVAFVITAAFVISLLLLAHSCARAQEPPVVAVIASVCLGGTCQEILVTSSEQDPRATMAYCGMPMALADWMGSNWPGYQLAGWKCVQGERRHET